MKKETKDYIDNKKFGELLQQYFSTTDPKTFNELGIIFLKITKNILRCPNFINYSQDRKNDMISDATYYMIRYIKRYDVDRGNPFAFFSQIAFNAFRQNINKVNKRKDVFMPLHCIENLETEMVG